MENNTFYNFFFLQSFNFQVRLMRFTAMESASSALQISSGSFVEINTKIRIEIIMGIEKN